MEQAWINGLVGGLLIGLSAALLLLLNGRIAGISGILGGLVDRKLPFDWAERFVFVAGLLVAPAIYFFTVAPEKTLVVTSNLPLIIVGGILVGIGTRMGAGCTSGHGVCGAARLSPRSIVAMLTFMATAIITVFVLRHVV